MSFSLNSSNGAVWGIEGDTRRLDNGSCMERPIYARSVLELQKSMCPFKIGELLSSSVGAILVARTIEREGVQENYGLEP